MTARGITLRVRRPAPINANLATPKTSSSGMMEEEDQKPPPSGSSLTSLEGGGTKTDPVREESIEVGGEDAKVDGDEEDDEEVIQDQETRTRRRETPPSSHPNSPSPRTSLRPKRARVSRNQNDGTFPLPSSPSNLETKQSPRKSKRRTITTTDTTIPSSSVAVGSKDGKREREEDGEDEDEDEDEKEKVEKGEEDEEEVEEELTASQSSPSGSKRGARGTSSKGRSSRQSNKSSPSKKTLSAKGRATTLTLSRGKVKSNGGASGRKGRSRTQTLASEEEEEMEEGGEQGNASDEEEVDQDQEDEDEDEDEGKRVTKRRRGAGQSTEEQEAEEEGQGSGEEGQGGEDEEEGEEGGGGNDSGVEADGMETITIQGETFRVENEELVLPSDPEGDKKVDEKGRLLGGREYKGYNFTSDLREDPERVYMLSIDAARSAGYRDSLYFFRKNPKIIKITLHQREKDKLIEDGRLSGQLKSRNVTMVAVRNVYKLHGAKFIKGGKSVIDDYYEAEARASGKKEGQAVGGISQEEQERRREADKERDRSRRRPDTYTHTSVDAQGEPFTTTFGDSGLNPLARAGNWSLRKQMLQRADVNEENWMLELAKSVRGMNTELYETRRDRLVAFRRFDNGLAEQEYYESSDEDEDEDEDEEGEAGAEGDADPADDEQAKEDLPPWERESQKSASPPAAAGSIIKSKTEDNDDAMQVDQQEGGGETSGLSSSAAAVAKKARRKRPAPPIGIYEPFTHLPHFATSTQPAWARIEKVAARPKYIKDPRQQTKDGTGASDDVPILGGGRMGATAWGLASFSTELVNPPPPSSVVRIPAPPKLSEGDDSKPNL